MAASPGDRDSTDDPSVDEIIGDLRLLRQRGLVRLRHTDLAGLGRLAAQSSFALTEPSTPGAIEALLNAAVGNLGASDLGAAAAATFGLSRGARDRPAQDRRRRAALAYGVSVERFRKYHERIVLEQVAEEILRLSARSAAGRPSAVEPAELGSQIVLDGRVAETILQLVVHVEPVELMSGVDIVVAPTNLYLELPQHFKSSVSAAVRMAAAVKTPDGQILTDVITDELTSWVAKHGRPGLPVAAGTAVATSSGEMAAQGIRRIYHVAVAAPLPGTNDYYVEATAVGTGVRNALATARAERDLFDPVLRSVGLPLLGAGRGGLDPAISFAWLWSSLEREIMLHGGPREIHFITRQNSLAELIVARLRTAGVIPG